MIIFGVDFTSRPSARKPIAVARALLRRRQLTIEGVERLTDFDRFEAWLRKPGPWIAGFDFPFGLPRGFVEANGAGRDWAATVRWAAALGREGFCAVTYPAFRAAKGDKAAKHRRVDLAAGSHSPLKTMDPVRRQAINPPVGLMFFEGAKRLGAAGLNIPTLRPNADTRIALEAYPGWLAKRLGFTRYKNDKPANAARLRQARRHLIDALREGTGPLAVRVVLSDALARVAIADATGDTIDAVLCAVEAAFAAGDARFGLPARVDSVEGWIVGVPPQAGGF